MTKALAPRDVGGVTVHAPAPTSVHPPATSGPAAPQGAVPVPSAEHRLPRRTAVTPAALWWVGVHGGAGETSLAQLVDGSHDGGHAWPQPPAGAQHTHLPVILVARSNWRGLAAAQAAATEWASGGVSAVHLLGLVVIADAPGKLPRPLKDFAVLVAGGVPRVWHLPWIDAWRTSATVTAATAPKQVLQLLDDVHALTTTPRPLGP